MLRLPELSAINEFVRKFKRAVGGAERPADATRPFDWQPSTPGGLAGGKPERAESATASAAAWAKPASEASCLIGAAIPADVVDFAIVYKAAGVSAPAHGYGIDRVAQMLAHESLAGLDKSVKSSVVLAALDAAGVPARDVIHDGLLRCKALLAFEAAKELEALATRPRNERRVQDLEDAMAAFRQKKRAEIDVLTREAAAAVASLQRLKVHQSAEEDRFHRTLSPFIEALPARIIAIPRPPAPETGKPTPVEPRPDLRLVAPAETKPAAAPAHDRAPVPAPIPAGADDEEPS